MMPFLYVTEEADAAIREIAKRSQRTIAVTVSRMVRAYVETLQRNETGAAADAGLDGPGVEKPAADAGPDLRGSDASGSPD